MLKLEIYPEAEEDLLEIGCISLKINLSMLTVTWIGYKKRP